MLQQIHFALSDSAHRVLVQLASFLPGVIALLLAVIILSAIGWGLAALLRRILQSARFDERLSSRTSSTSLSDWSPNNSPTLLLTRIVFWAFVVLGIIIGLSAFDASYATNSSVEVFMLPYLTHSVGAIVLLFIGTLISRFLARSVLIGAVNARLQYARFLSLGVKWLVLVLTAAMVLDHLGIGGAVIELAFGILFGGIVLTLALAIGLGSRDLVSRSLERNVDRFDPTMPDPVTTTAEANETLRHF